jgi:asparagine synthase (glutamine-hydrolysing)
MRPTLGRTQLEAMMRSLRHRGPDDEGLALWDEAGRAITDERPGAAGLAHTRLSVIDLSNAGHQPMPGTDENLWITFNGEIYNFEEQRRELAARGRLFRSHTDTETILNLCEEYGLSGALARMNGMFAFAIWDRRRRTLALARDRAGKKPLYYTLRPDGTLLFASEIKALLASGCVDASRLDEAAIVQFWTYGYVMGERTFFRDIRRLLPGHCAEWSDGKFSTRAYWDCPFGQGGWENRSVDDLADELEALLADAIRLRLIADVPVGLFLSGGIDSSLVAALARCVAGPDLQTFTIAFTEDSHDESKHAAAIARHLGVVNRVLTVAEHLQDHFQSIACHFDEPFGDSSAIPTFFVAALARRHVTVALTGDGGDELFAGYQNHVEALRQCKSAPHTGTSAQRTRAAVRSARAAGSARAAAAVLGAHLNAAAAAADFQRRFFALHAADRRFHRAPPMEPVCP